MGWRKQRISYLLQQSVTPKKRSGRPPVFDTTKRKKIIQFVESGAEVRDLKLTSLSA